MTGATTTAERVADARRRPAAAAPPLAAAVGRPAGFAAPGTAPLHAAARRRSIGLRTALVAGGVVAVAAALAFGMPASGPAADPTLATLLRGMAAIKALIAAAAFALVAWRLGLPIGAGRAAVCIAAVAAMVGATAAIAALSSIVPAAIAFHVGMVALALAGWHDDAVARMPVVRGIATAASRRGAPTPR